jgi:hypothetical protein
MEQVSEGASGDGRGRRAGRRRSKLLLRVVTTVALVAPLGAAVATAPASATAPSYVFDNGRLRFGGGGHASTTPGSREASIDSHGNLKQPYYWSATAGKWFKLTYSVYPLDLAIGSGTGGGNWSGADVVENPTLVGQAIDGTGFTTASSSGDSAIGSGRLRSTGTVDLNGADVQVSNTYELGATASFVKVTTKLENTDSSPVDNVNLWVGTRDDWVGNSDGPTKTKGNLVDGAFEATTQATTPGAALRITSANEGVLFYSTTPGTNTSIDRCCSFANAYAVDPSSSPTTLSGDGSYALHLPAGTLAAGASAEIVWYYAAGTLADLDSVVREVANAAAPRPDVAVGDGQVTVSWDEPTSDSPITDYVIRYTSDGGTTWTSLRHGSVATPLTHVLEGLANGTSYRVEIAAVTGTGESEVVGPWSPTSDIVVPGIPTNQVAPTIAGDAVVGSTVHVVDPDENWENHSAGEMTASYQWLADGEAITGATGTTLAVTGDLVGKVLTVTATRTNAVGHVDVTSAATATVPHAPRLGGLVPSLSELAPAFTPGTTHYALTVPTGTTSVSLTPTALDEGATVTVDGITVTDGTEHSISLPVGTTTVTVRVTLDGQTTEYVLTVTRPAEAVAPAPQPAPPVLRPAPPTPPVVPTPTPVRVAPAPPILGFGAGTGTGTGAGTGTGGASTPAALYIASDGKATDVKLPARAPSRNVAAAVAVTGSESIAVTPTGQLFTTNPAHNFGQVPSTRHLNAPVTNVGLRWSRTASSASVETASATGWAPSGYWLAAADGGVFAFGSARFHGSMGATPLNKQVVGIAPTQSGEGYWLVAADGGVFTFGDARFAGSLGSRRLNQPIVSIVPTSTGRGYWLIAVDGGVFAFGDADYLGSGAASGRRFIGAAPSLTGKGYWLVGDDRKLLAFGDAEQP